MLFVLSRLVVVTRRMENNLPAFKKNEFFKPKVGLRALFSDPHWLAPYLLLLMVAPPPAPARRSLAKIKWREQQNSPSPDESKAK